MNTCKAYLKYLTTVYPNLSVTLICLILMFKAGYLFFSFPPVLRTGASSVDLPSTTNLCIDGHLKSFRTNRWWGFCCGMHVFMS